MIFWAWIAASAAAATPVPAAPAVPVSIIVSEAEHAIHAGRLDQARLMIARIVGMGVKGPPVEHLMADLDFASGKDREALARYQQLLKTSPDDSQMSENAGIAALRIGEIAVAGPLIERATAGRAGRGGRGTRAACSPTSGAIGTARTRLMPAPVQIFPEPGGSAQQPGLVAAASRRLGRSGRLFRAGRGAQSQVRADGQ